MNEKIDFNAMHDPNPGGTTPGWQCYNCGMWVTSFHNCAAIPVQVNPVIYPQLDNEKLDKIINMLEDLTKRIEALENA